MIRNENNRHTETIDSIIDEVYSRRNINSGNNVDIENGKATRRDDRLYNKQQKQSRQRNDNEENVRFSRELEDSSFSLSEQLEKSLEKTLFGAENERQGMIDLFNSYLEENDITNPTQEDIDNSLDTYDLMDANDEGENLNKVRDKYTKTIKEYLKSQSVDNRGKKLSIEQKFIYDL